MTFDRWVQIALIIATLIGPISRPVVKLFRRSNQPKESPDLNQPKTLIRRIGSRLWNILQSPWYVPGFLILANIFSLRLELLSTAPITRHAVFSICESVAGILYGLILMFYNIAYQSAKDQWKINARQREINAKQDETDNRIFGLLDTHTDILRSTVDDLNTTAQNINLMLEAEEARAQTQDLRAKLAELESTEGRKKGRRQLK
jgi:hypothetical protein